MSSQTLLDIDEWTAETDVPADSMHAGTTHRGPKATPALFSLLLFAAVPASSPALQGGTRTKVGSLGGWRRNAGAPLADPRQSPRVSPIRGRGRPPSPSLSPRRGGATRHEKRLADTLVSSGCGTPPADRPDALFLQVALHPPSFSC